MPWSSGKMDSYGKFQKTIKSPVLRTVPAMREAMKALEIDGCRTYSLQRKDHLCCHISIKDLLEDGIGGVERKGGLHQVW